MNFFQNYSEIEFFGNYSPRWDVGGFDECTGLPKRTLDMSLREKISPNGRLRKILFETTEEAKRRGTKKKCIHEII